MKHRIFGKKLGRTHNQRQALLTGLVRNIFTHGSIKTTDAKAKSVIPVVERLSNIVMTKPDLVARRQLFCYLQDQSWVNRVYTAMQSTFSGQVCNFTNVTSIKYRQGDDAQVVKLAFIKPVNFAPAPKVEEKKVEKKAVIKKTVKKVTKKEVKK